MLSINQIQIRRIALERVYVKVDLCLSSKLTYARVSILVHVL